MNKISIEELARQVDLHISNESYQQGLELTTQMLQYYPERQNLIDYWRICLAALAGEEQTACQILETALSNGIWYAEHVLRQSPPLAVLQNFPKFENLVHISAGMEKADPIRKLPLLITHSEGNCKEGKEACPLLIYLHSNESTAAENLQYWHPAAMAGWLLALPQALQAFWAGAFGWHDYETSAEQLEKQIEKMVGAYRIDPERIVLAGSGAGAGTALWLALSGRIKANGLLLVNPDGPYLRNTDTWTKVYDLEAAAETGLNILVLYDSSAAYIIEENLFVLKDTLQNLGIGCELETFRSPSGTSYPDDFADTLADSLDQILFGM